MALSLTSQNPTRACLTPTSQAETKEFFHAISVDNLDVVKQFLGKGVSADLTDENGQSAFSLAAELGKTDLIEAMRPYHPDVNFILRPQTSRYTPLMLAAINGQADTITALLKFSELNKNQQDAAGQTALHKACRIDTGYAGKVEAVEALIAGGVDQGVRDKYGYTAYKHVKNEDPIPAHKAQLLSILISDEKMFFDAIGQNKVEFVKESLANDISANLTDENGQSAFSLATELGKTDLIEAMRPYHPDVNFILRPQTSRYTPLMLAAINGQADTITALLKFSELNKNQQDAAGQTALHKACRIDTGYAGKVEAVEALIAGGVDQGVRDKYGYTAYKHVKNEDPIPAHKAQLLSILTPQPEPSTIAPPPPGPRPYRQPIYRQPTYMPDIVHIVANQDCYFGGTEDKDLAMKGAFGTVFIKQGKSYDWRVTKVHASLHYGVWLATVGGQPLPPTFPWKGTTTGGKMIVVP